MAGPAAGGVSTAVMHPGEAERKTFLREGLDRLAERLVLTSLEGGVEADAQAP